MLVREYSAGQAKGLLEAYSPHQERKRLDKRYRLQRDAESAREIMTASTEDDKIAVVSQQLEPREREERPCA